MAESSSLSSAETSLRQSSAKKRKEKEEMAETATDQNPGGEDTIPECAVCLQTCVQPVRLPCTHIFCYLCVKGVANQSKRCALCRQEIPVEYLERPELVKPVKVAEEEEEEEEEVYCWFYEGRNGWWQYDERTNAELEDAYTKKKKSCELLIAGFLYIIDFVNMLQFRRNDPSRRRRIKRDLMNTPKKGVAGVRLSAPAPPRNAPADGVEGANDGATGATGGNRSVTVTSRATKSTGGSDELDEDTNEENGNRAEEDTTSEDLMDQSARGNARQSPDSLRQHTPTQEEEEEDTTSSGGAEMTEMVRMLQRSHLGRGSDSSRSGVLQAVLQGQISSAAPVAMAREAIPGDSSDESD
ncbi:RNF146 [Branchiostoma lanceolatum]|uniref:E3 ubiquitin-protein ligase n=1 Tax=Branchiostoma lanceolatum TaxID=7740 RepID=A0A8K0EM58_BRALA|nr:RNF146 [Branchiostoma lanceolatum]